MSLSRGGVALFLILLCVVLAISGRQIWRGWPATTSASNAESSSSASAPVQAPNGDGLSSLQLPAGRTLVYEQADHIYTIATGEKSSHALQTPGYSYNRAVPAVVTTGKELLYSGAGIWRVNLSGGPATQIASLPSDQVITSMVVSSDGSTLAWSSAPKNGSGTISLYAGPLDHTSRVYQQPANKCPCFRAFAFPNNDTHTLMLTNDRGDHRSARYGLWKLNLDQGASAQPQPYLSDANQQGPLALAPQGNSLLYSTFQGYVPMQEENAPADISSLSYANSLSVASIGGAQTQLDRAQTLLPEQGDLENTEEYRWVSTPQFSSDARTLAYTEFSVSSVKHFPRQYALYTVDLHGAGGAKPQLLATSTAHYMETGAWLDDHTITFYADHALYALDIQQHSVARIIATGAYANVIAAIE
ncbi:hypothetical protein KDH_55900 [Dictyobacter sp. S3.2.2.5]|uniref:Lipoprotein LpqB beta-propeller domain-containing protein n=1 Tax=Dictyobacter halimunensis TaxID=3026934 RepID=A0ABQ6G0Y0_9CHLR|nr:hypothetical protein KDH_55900 [Dictyobacter sp. S3.2.2.5]